MYYFIRINILQIVSIKQINKITSPISAKQHTHGTSFCHRKCEISAELDKVSCTQWLAIVAESSKDNKHDM